MSGLLSVSRQALFVKTLHMVNCHDQHLQGVWAKLIFLDDLKATQRTKGVVPPSCDRPAHDYDASSITSIFQPGDVILCQNKRPQVSIQEHKQRRLFLNRLYRLLNRWA